MFRTVIYVGTSGWQYAHWRGPFYPRKLPQRRWLEHFSARFQTAEVNNTFYNLPEESVFEDWSRRVPDDFTFSLKMSRFLTHIKRLRDPAEPVHRFLQRARRLGGKRGPTLLQLPPNMKADAVRLEAALSEFSPDERVAVEFRHDSWFVPSVRSVLERRGAALCLTDGLKPSPPHWRTADWAYVRFHHGGATPDPCYGRAALATWAERLASMWPARADVFAYFNNDGRGCALRDAIVLARLAAEAGLKPTRVPGLDEVSIAA
jgi:uncharacterized protein YecE (DUF72 family)